jgi:RHS repeat-associated protein
LARTELGDNQVQGVDYAYNLQGWIKGINSGALLPENDMGHDSEISAGNPDNPNKFFAKDVASFSLHYFEGDYQKISSSAADFLPQSTGSYLVSQSEYLWNGNIGCMMTNLADPDPADNPQGDKWGMLGMAYRYDQLNRIKSADGFMDYNVSSNTWGTAVESSIYNNAFTYDGNGNILTQHRSDQNNIEFENLTYQYKKTEVGEKMLQNRLYHVNEDPITPSAYTDDIEDQGAFDADNVYSTDNNYGYTELGELERDNAEHIEGIDWRVDSKISYIRRVDNTTTNELAFDYDAMGNRIAKHIYNSNGVYEKSTFYVRDASGNVMANYEFVLGESLSGSSLKIKERPMYGSSRLGMDVTTFEFIGAVAFEVADTTSRRLGHKQYEISNHLGNVLSVVSDVKLPRVDGGTVVAYSAAVISVTDYSPFGVALYGRKWQSEGYSYGFQSQEQDGELWEGVVTFKYRVEDARLGRFFSVDPLHSKYPWNSVFAFSENKVINAIELEGLEAQVLTQNFDNDGNTTSSTFVWDESASPLENGMVHYIENKTNADGTISSSLKIVSADEIDYKGGQMNPTVAPSSIIGTTAYYAWRDNDFNIRQTLIDTWYNWQPSAPDYYLGYGDKYIKRFTNDLYPELSEAGKAWLEGALLNLQIAIENQLKINPEIESDNSDFQNFAYDSHVAAYENAGLFKLPISDMVKIVNTPDIDDILSAEGIRQIGQVATDYYDYAKKNPTLVTAQFFQFALQLYIFFND